MSGAPAEESAEQGYVSDGSFASDDEGRCTEMVTEMDLMLVQDLMFVEAEATLRAEDKAAMLAHGTAAQEEVAAEAETEMETEGTW